MKSGAILRSAAAVACACGLAHAQSFQGIGRLSGSTVNASNAFGVSSTGDTVVGFSNVAGGVEACVWTGPGTIASLGHLPGATVGSYAYGVSGNGAIIVGQSFSTAGQQAFRWTPGGGMVGLGDIGGGAFFSQANAISNDGTVIVGQATSANGSEAFRWTQPGGFLALGDLPGSLYSSVARGVSADGAVICGASISSNGTEAFRWTQAAGMVALGAPPNSTPYEANGISGNGMVIVGKLSADFGMGSAAFRWTQATGTVSLGDLPGSATAGNALATNFDGSIVVGNGFTSLGVEAFIWDAANGMRNLKAVLLGLGVSAVANWTLNYATAISPDGLVVVGTGRNPAGEEEGWIARLNAPSPCYANCDASTTNPVLNVNDFVCFQNRFAAGDPYANCDNSTSPPVLNVADFICFLNRYAAGCT
ncbi:MAG: PEP-CTERM sorting domain-containing protein [Phycisphaerae bacterium]|nr:PEP-CTERM sorting domain-containing protein [Phycisphaerae bacterium]